MLKIKANQFLVGQQMQVLPDTHGERTFNKTWEKIKDLNNMHWTFSVSITIV